MANTTTPPLNRRDLLAAAAVMAAAAPTGPAMAQPGFKLVCLNTMWGYAGGVAAFCAETKAAGFDGAELLVDLHLEDAAAMASALNENGLQYGFLLGTWIRGGFREHFEDFKRKLDAALTAPLRPLFINCHAGRDYFTREQNQAFLDLTFDAARRSGIPFHHETHRGRLLYAAPLARPILQRNPEMRVTFDVSHWCAVSESLLEDQTETLDLTIGRTDHIHARVGHANGPQVSDPRAPEWADALAAHLAWWDRIVAAKRQAGATLTVLSEFGPPTYQPTLPYTNVPVSDQWAINVHMMELFRRRYG